MAKYTAIYIDSWMSGSHMQTVTKFLRFETLEKETMGDALKRLNIDYSTVFIFVGHPILQGEENEQSQDI